MTTAPPSPPAPAPVSSPAPAAKVPSLTSVFVRLKLSILKNGLKQSGGRMAAYISSIVFAGLVTIGMMFAFLGLRGSAHAGTVTVLLVGVLALGWTVMPLFIPSGDETLDPSRLVMLPLRPRPLTRALLVASLIGVGPAMTLVLALGAALALTQGAVAAVVAVLAVPLVLVGCVALSRAVAAANIRLLTSRKGRDLALLSGLVIAVGFQFVNLGIQRLTEAGGLSTLRPAAQVVGWLPPASAVSAIDAANDGDYASAAAKLLISAAALAGLVAWWQRSLVRLMTEPDGSTIGASPGAGAKAKDPAAGGGGLARLLPDGRAGAVMERTLRYIWRDPKTKASWVTSLAVGLIVPLVNTVQGNGSLYWACFATSMLGLQMFNQFGQDTSAFWMVAQTIGTKADAYAELKARAVALLVITLPYTLLVFVVTAVILDDWNGFAQILGAALTILGAMVGLGAVASTNMPYSIPQDSAYKNVAPGQGGLAWMSMFSGMFAAGLLGSPVLVPAVVMDGSDSVTSVALLIGGALYGALLVWGGLKLAAPRLAKRLPEILAAVSKG